MTRVIYIKESKHGEYIAVGIADGEEKKAFVMPRAIYDSLGAPTRGCEVSEDDLAVMGEASEEYRAMKKALSLLSYADNSERGLKMKLLRAGYSREASDAAVREVVRLGYVNEDSQLERLILAEANSRLIGPMKLLPKLSSKGYSVAHIKQVLSRLRDEGAVDFEANRRRLLEKKLDEGASDEQRQKLLKSFGYKPYGF